MRGKPSNILIVLFVVLLAGFSNSLLPMYPWKSFIIKFIIFSFVTGLYFALWILFFIVLSVLTPWRENNSILASYPLVPKIVEGFSIAYVVFEKGIDFNTELSLQFFFKLMSFTPFSQIFSLISTVFVVLITVLLLKPVKLTIKSVLLATIPALLAYFL